MLTLPRTLTPEQIERARLWAAHRIARNRRFVLPDLVDDTDLTREAVQLIALGESDSQIVAALKLIFGRDRAQVTTKQVAILREIAPEAARAADYCVVEKPGRRIEMVPPVFWSTTFGAVISHLWERREAARVTLPRMVTDPQMWTIVWTAVGYLHETEIAEELAIQGFGEDLLGEVSRLLIRLERIGFVDRPACLTVPDRRRYRGTSPHRRKSTIRLRAAAASVQCVAALGAPLTPGAQVDLAQQYVGALAVAPLPSIADRMRLAAFAADAYRPVLAAAAPH